MRRGKQLIVWISDELYVGMERARGKQSRSDWLRRAIERHVTEPERPLFASTDPVVSPAPTPAPERKETARW